MITSHMEDSQYLAISWKNRTMCPGLFHPGGGLIFFIEKSKTYEDM